MRRNWHTGRGTLKVLNVESAVDEEVIANVEDHCTSDSAVQGQRWRKQWAS